jgi:hypothetical protein
MLRSRVERLERTAKLRVSALPPMTLEEFRLQPLAERIRVCRAECCAPTAAHLPDDEVFLAEFRRLPLHLRQQVVAEAKDRRHGAEVTRQFLRGEGRAEP